MIEYSIKRTDWIFQFAKAEKINYCVEHDCTLSNRNFILKMKKPKNLGFEPVHPKNLLLASVVHGISCLFLTISVRNEYVYFRYEESKKVKNLEKNQQFHSSSFDTS
jgi:hypothetical protein